MKDRTNWEVSFKGEDGFRFNRLSIRSLIESLTQDTEEMNLYFGINEAVCNALLYGKAGPNRTEVKISIWVDKGYMAVRIFSESKGFNVRSYREKMLDMAKEMDGDWAVALRESIRGRGLWMMLTGADKVIYNEFGNEVMLVTKIPVVSVERRGKSIVSKLFIKNENEGMVVCEKT